MREVSCLEKSDILRVVNDAASPNHHAGGNGGNLRSHTDECWECHAPDTPILTDSELSECFMSVPHLSPKSCLGDSVRKPILSDCSDMEADMPPWTTKATVLTDKNATHPLIHAHRKRWDSLSGIDSEPSQNLPVYSNPVVVHIPFHGHVSHLTLAQYQHLAQPLQQDLLYHQYVLPCRSRLVAV